MSKIVSIIAAAAALLTASCGTTGFLGLAKEESVVEMNEKQDREIAELKSRLERIDALSEQLETALAEVKQAETEAAEALALARAGEKSAAALEKKVAEVRGLLKKLEGRIDELPAEVIGELARVLKTYSRDADAEEAPEPDEPAAEEE